MTAIEDDVMTHDERPSTSLLEVSLDAALERLVDILKEGRPVLAGAPVSMLSDVRGITIVRRALSPATDESDTDKAKMKALITAYLDKLVEDAKARSARGLVEAKRFCLALNRELLKRQHEKLTSRRWRQESAA